MIATLLTIAAGQHHSLVLYERPALLDPIALIITARCYGKFHAVRSQPARPSTRCTITSTRCEQLIRYFTVALPRRFHRFTAGSGRRFSAVRLSSLLQNQLSHMNVPWHFGDPRQRSSSITGTTLCHHSREPSHFDRNYAAIFSIHGPDLRERSSGLDQRLPEDGLDAGEEPVRPRRLRPWREARRARPRPRYAMPLASIAPDALTAALALA